MEPYQIKSLSYEQRKKYKHAIKQGYFRGYDDNPRLWRHSFAGTFLWKNPGRTKIVDTLKGIIGHVPQWDDIDETTLKDLVTELEERGLAPSSIRTMCAELKAVLNDNKKLVPCDRDDFTSILSVKGTTSQAVYLTREEMLRIINYPPHTDLERYVKRNFCVGMLTGARRVDAERLTMANCDMKTNILSYVPQKTPGIVVHVPVDERLSLREFLQDDTQRNVCQNTFNDVIRHICMTLRINAEVAITKAGDHVTAPKWQFVSSHTARRTFATNLYLAGISLEDIALMMGHGKNIETTKRYICAARELSSDVLSYFQPKPEECYV